ncbi:unnamed protein product [Effrenium voratum]|uniref:Uncharacterized protein n=1 Tax=Effrenium voratum TaxID=2562239 RepID=A0AA36HU02_9DINO|nr:unnamed protein product [Effrenium voratum]
MTAGARRFPKGVNAGFSALLQLVKITEGLSHAGLQQELAQKVLVAVDSCQAQVQGCVKLLLEALALSKQQHSPELALDSAWALNELAQKSNVVSGWILGCGSTSLLRECLIVYCDRRDTVEICTWLVGKTGGLKGLLSLLRGDPALPQQVVVRVFDIICKDSSFWRDKDGPIEEAGQLLRCAAEAAKFAAQQGPRQLLEAKDAMRKFLEKAVQKDEEGWRLLNRMPASSCATPPSSDAEQEQAPIAPQMKKQKTEGDDDMAAAQEESETAGMEVDSGALSPRVPLAPSGDEAPRRDFNSPVRPSLAGLSEQGTSGGSWDEVPEVVAGTHPRGATATHVMHLVDQDLRTVGCGWSITPQRAQHLSPEDYAAEPAKYVQCSRCFRYYSLPEDWEEAHADTSHVDTLSDKEAIQLPFIRKVAQPP